jgi:hypothetical protein
MSGKGLKGASTKTFKGEINRLNAIVKLGPRKYHDKAQYLFGTDYKNPIHQKKKKNIGNAMNRLESIGNKYQKKIDNLETPISKTVDRIYRGVQTMGKLSNVAKVVAPISGLLIAKDMLTAKPAGKGSTFYKTGNYKKVK